MSYSGMVRGLVPSMSDVSAEPFWWDCRIGSYMIRSKRWMPFWEWRCLVSYQVAQSRTRGHSDMTVGLVPTRSDVSACLLEHSCWIGSSHVSDVSAEPFRHEGLVPCMVKYKCWVFPNHWLNGCECWAFLTGLWAMLPHGQMWVLGVAFFIWL